MTKIPQEKIEQLIQNLQGSCNSLSEECEKLDFIEDDLTQKDLEYINEIVYCCTNCNWWYESGDQNIEGECNDCQKDEEDEEDD